jgi:hypothetical protein
MVALAFVFVAVDTITVNSAQAQTCSDDVIDDDECKLSASIDDSDIHTQATSEPDPESDDNTLA